MNPTRLALALCLLALPAIAAPDPAEQSYQAARKGYYALKKDPKRRKFRDSWLTVAHRFESVAKKYPKSPRAPDSLFTAAQLLLDLSRISLLTEDATASMDDDRALLETYPLSPLADDAALALAQAYLDREQPDAARKVLQRAAQLPKGDQTARLRALAASLPPEAKETIRKAGKGEALARRETLPPEARPAATREAPADETRSSKTASRDVPAVDRHATAPSRDDPRPGASARVPPETRSSTVVTVRQGPAVETPDWLKDVTASKTPSIERDTRPSEEARTPDEDEETPTPPAAAEPVAETR
ncbi:MAG: N-acetylmuramoyl-L-alanine amidase, partial [Myxococcaceae bacterium]